MLLASCGGGGDSAPGDGSRQSEDQREQALAIAPPSGAKWSGIISLPIVPGAAANLPNGKVMLWSSYAPLAFGSTGQTYTVLFDPASQSAMQTVVAATGHDMFCPGTTLLSDGTLLVNGGDDNTKTSLYNAFTNTWSTAAKMNIGRGYEGNTLLSDGSVMTYGGSWSGPRDRKYAEIWTATGGWRTLSGVPAGPATANDPGGVYRGDNHFWLFPSPNGQVFQAGPSSTMNWIDTQGNGSVVSAGLRGDDPYSMNGNAVMYDVGKILKVGGAPAYENAAATNAAYAIDVNAGVTVRKLAPMNYPRTLSNSVVLPTGQVLVVGGQVYSKLFSDDGSVLPPELWDPATQAFTVLPAMSVARNYHSFAMLLPDARVLTGGGGLCGDGCAGNHPDLQVFSPNYLFDENGNAAVRPVITSAPAAIGVGTTVPVKTGTAVTAFSLIRMGAVTHSINNDQRRIPLAFTGSQAAGYNVVVPGNSSVVLPGYYMLFAMNASGVPSVSKTVQITTSSTPRLSNPGARASIVGTSTQVIVNATAVSGSLTYGAIGLPAGMSINASTGVISGTPTGAGTSHVTLSARDSGATATTQFQWTVSAAGSQRTRRYVRFEALSNFAGTAQASIAEFDLLDQSGVVIPRTGWSVTADSEDAYGVSEAGKAFDGDPATYWLAQTTPDTPMPHKLVIDLGTARAVGGLSLLPRAAGGAGAIAAWRFSSSPDGVTWVVVGQGTFANTPVEKALMFDGSPAPTNQPPMIGSIANRTNNVGQTVSLAVSANDDEGDAMTYAASGLPPGLAIAANSGAISGTLTTAGTYNITVQVSDSHGAAATRPFVWTVVSGTTGAAVQFVRLEALTEINGSPWTSMAEFNVLDASGTAYARNGWMASADSAELVGESAGPEKAIDGDPASIWHTQWSGNTVFLLPHTYTVNMGVAHVVAGFSYLPRPGGGNGTIASWRFHTSVDGVRWTLVAQDTFANSATEKTAMFAGPGGGTSVNHAPVPAEIAARADLVGTALTVALSATDSDGDVLTWSASGLPPGLGLSANTGTISGTLTTAGTYGVTVQVGDGKGGTATRAFSWTVSPAPTGSISGPVQYVRLQAVSEINGKPLTSMAEFNLLDANGAVMSRTGWNVSVDSAETVAENAPASNAIDGNAASYWHTQYQGTTPPLPHIYTVNLGAAKTVGGFKYLPRAGGDNNTGGFGSIAGWRFYSSTDGTTWTLVQQGTFTAAYAEKAVTFPKSANTVPVLGAVANQTATAGTAVSLALSATDADGDVLTYGATSLPAGLAINPSTGAITGTPTTTGVSNVTAQVSDGRGGVATRAFTWSIAAALNVAPVLGAVPNQTSAAGQAVSLALSATDGNGDTLTWSATGLPAGLSISSVSGLITGSPTTVAQYTANVTVGDGRGGTASRSFTWSITVAPNQPPVLAAIANRSDAVGSAVSMALSASDVDGGALTFSATGLPAGLALNAASGVISGTPTAAGVYSPAASVSDGRGGVATRVFTWTITAATTGGLSARYVKLEAVSEVNGNPWTSVAEFNLLDTTGAVMSRAGWTVTADSVETVGENGAVAQAIDGDPSTFWHTQWSPSSPALPHAITVNLGATRVIGGFKYLPRPLALNGTIAGWRFHTSADGVSWSMVASGTFANSAAEKTVYPITAAVANQPPVLTTVASQSNTVGQTVSLPMSASDADGDTLAFSATGLPAGLSINGATGLVTGVATTIGTSTAAVQVSDGRGGVASRSFTWSVTAATTGTTVLYVRLEALSEINGNPWTSIAEFNLLDRSGAVLSRTGWTLAVDSVELVGENAPATNAIDGDANSFWHTQWSLASPAPPHTFTVNLGTARAVGGFKVLPRPGGANNTAGNGSIAAWRFYTSNNGTTWTQIASGTFTSALGEKVVTLP